VFSDRVVEKETSHVRAQEQDAREKLAVGKTTTVVVEEPPEANGGKAATHVNGIVTFVKDADGPRKAMSWRFGSLTYSRTTRTRSRSAEEEPFSAEAVLITRSVAVSRPPDAEADVAVTQDVLDEQPRDAVARDADED
jgi:hypothetical protein